MTTARYVHWQDGEMWLGYLEEFPDYLTQGGTVTELEDNLRDLYRDSPVARFRASADLLSYRAELSVG
jgi:hypothetical protein